MSTFDSSNPTKDWGYPDLLDRPTDLTNNEAKVASTGTVSMSASTLVDNLSVTVKVNFILQRKSNISTTLFDMFCF